MIGKACERSVTFMDMEAAEGCDQWVQNSNLIRNCPSAFVLASQLCLIESITHRLVKPRVKPCHCVQLGINNQLEQL